MAHHIIVDDYDYGFAIAKINDERTELVVVPFQGEVHSTSFISGTVRIRKIEGKYRIFAESLKKYL